MSRSSQSRSGKSPSRYRRAAAAVRQAQAGDRGAVRTVLEAVAPSVLCVTRRIMNDRPEAEDVAQDALIDLVADLQRLREPDAVVAYACQIASRRAIRAQQRLRRSLSDAIPAVATTSTEDAVDRRELAQRLLAKLAELPPAQAESLVMRIVLGCSLAEVADATGVGVNTVRSRIRLAKQTLAAQLEDELGAQPPTAGGSR